MGFDRQKLTEKRFFGFRFLIPPVRHQKQTASLVVLLDALRWLLLPKATPRASSVHGQQAFASEAWRYKKGVHSNNSVLDTFSVRSLLQILSRRGKLYNTVAERLTSLTSLSVLRRDAVYTQLHNV